MYYGNDVYHAHIMVIMLIVYHGQQNGKHWCAVCTINNLHANVLCYIFSIVILSYGLCKDQVLFRAVGEAI